MEPLKIAQTLQEKFPADVLGITEYAGEISVTVKKNNILALMRFLHDEPSIHLDYLRDLCGADYMGIKENRFEVVYQLLSINHNHGIRIKAEVPEKDCTIDSVISIWRGVDWHERECFDLYGITFKGHPDLRRILLPEDWKGHPLRKDYPLKGPGPEEEWEGFKEVVRKAERFKEFEWNNT